jgi:hypothetical protein
MTTAMKPLVEHEQAPARPAYGECSSTPPGSNTRWWGAVAAAVLAAVPCGVVLSYAALLPFFIGVFFFALFGLILGALAFRIGSPGKPYETAPIILGTTLIILTAFAVSLLKEGRDFPADMANRAIKETRNIGAMTAAEFRGRATVDVQQFLRSQYWPGGTIGYLHWALTSGRIPQGTFTWMEKELRLSQARYLFALRVAISLGLLAFGVASQTWAMRHRR